MRAALHAGGCVIAGAAGVGKSRLADEAASALDGADVMRVLATASATTVPFGAFGHLMEAEPGRLGVAIPRFVALLRARYRDPGRRSSSTTRTCSTAAPPRSSWRWRRPAPRGSS